MQIEKKKKSTARNTACKLPLISCYIAHFLFWMQDLWHPGQETKWRSIIFMFSYFCQKVYPCKDFTFHTRLKAQRQFKLTNHGHLIGPMSL